ncbi:MAG: hypothetical protein GWP06_15745 [Actinobacteria bacterium]|nr:hypothetical protein [Actinomycetota bacterium]
MPSGEVNEPVLNGSGKTRIVKILPPGSTGQVTLTMNINPAEAVNHGCNVTPAPGPHQYDSGTEINVYALPNEAAGWYFTDWSGDACGTDLIAHLVMDRDKTATANFAEFKLTVYRQAGAAGLLY